MGCPEEMRICLKTHITTSICKHTLQLTAHITLDKHQWVFVVCVAFCHAVLLDIKEEEGQTWLWDGKLRWEAGVQNRCPHKEIGRWRNTHRYAETFIRYIKDIAESHVHAHLLSHIHADVNTHIRLIKRVRKHAHIHLPLFHTLSYSVSPPQLHPWGTIWTVLSVATMCGPCCGINHYLHFFFYFQCWKSKCFLD